MKKFLSWGFAAALICGLNMFTSCSTDDNPVKPTDNLTEKIIGKWMEAEIDGKPALTNAKSVMTFVSSTKAISSESLVNFTPTLPRWNSFVEFEVQKDGNKLTLTGHPQDTVTKVEWTSQTQTPCEHVAWL